MKSTTTISLSGKVFHIEEDAYRELKNYVATLKGHYEKMEGGTEIMEDIESRIAELFFSSLSQPTDAVTIDMVKHVMSVMGEPAAFFEGDDEEIPDDSKTSRNTGSTYAGSAPAVKPQKKLYRDPYDRILGGVCSGLAAYFGMSPLAVRLIFALCFLITSAIGGLFFWLYVILWIVVPKAITPAQRLEMRGIPINVDNIEKSVKDGWDTLTSSETKEKIEKGAHSFGDWMESAFPVFLKICGYVLGFILLLCGIGSLCSAIFLPIGHWFGEGLMDWLPFGFPFNILCSLGVSAVIVALGIIFIFLAIRLFRPEHKSKSYWAPILALVLFILGVVFLVFSGLSMIS